MGGQGKKYPESNDTKNGDSVFSKTQFSLCINSMWNLRERNSKGVEMLNQPSWYLFTEKKLRFNSFRLPNHFSNRGS